MFITVTFRWAFRLVAAGFIIGLIVGLSCQRVKASTITIMVGQPLHAMSRDQVPQSAEDISTPLVGRTMYLYRDTTFYGIDPQFWANTSPDFNLVYDGKASATPEASTWLMILIGTLLLTIVRHTKRRSQVAKATAA